VRGASQRAGLHRQSMLRTVDSKLESVGACLELDVGGVGAAGVPGLEAHRVDWRVIAVRDAEVEQLACCETARWWRNRRSRSGHPSCWWNCADAFQCRAVLVVLEDGGRWSH